MPLDPQAEAVLAPLAAVDLGDLSLIPPAAMRQIFKQMPGADAPVVELAEVSERTLPGPLGEIPVRVYVPEMRGPLPVLMYFHGGGFVLCDLDTHDGTARELASAAGCVVVSVDYRLAPEAKFPAAPEDCYAATCWVAENGASLGIDTQRIAVAGDSAGGNLAAAVALMARDRGGPALRHQLLIYPVTNHDFDTPSYEENAEGYLLSRDMMRWFWNHYLADPADGDNPLASPLRAEHLAGVAPATVITAEYDPLRDEGEAYGERLRKAGVPVEITRYDGMIHGFFVMTQVVDKAKQAVEQSAEALRRSFA